jgi:hypothetical protein
MKIEDLINGRTYRLTRDVVNPELDKRERYNPNKLRWCEGDKLRCVRFNVNDYDTTAPGITAEMRERMRQRVAFDALVMHGTPRGVHGSKIYESHDGFGALVDALELTPETVSDIIEAHNGHLSQGVEYLRILLDSGTITREQLVSAIEQRNNEPD